MSEHAQVTSIEALKDFHADLCIFADRAKDGLSSAQMKIQRVLDWLEEQNKFWQREVRRWEDAVTQARTELARRKMMKIGDRTPDCTEQEDILRAAQRRLDEVEEKLAKTRRWLPNMRRSVDEYQGPARQLSGFLEGEQSRALALLQQKIDALEAYARLATPTTDPKPSA
jgi:hypothetical protein